MKAFCIIFWYIMKVVDVVRALPIVIVIRLFNLYIRII